MHDLRMLIGGIVMLFVTAILVADRSTAAPVEPNLGDVAAPSAGSLSIEPAS